jgi:hypothetical protein
MAKMTLSDLGQNVEEWLGVSKKGVQICAPFFFFMGRKAYLM